MLEVGVQLRRARRGVVALQGGAECRDEGPPGPRAIEERQQSPRSEADAAHVGVKTEMLQLRLMEKRWELVRRTDVDEPIDGVAGTVLTHLLSLPARCAPRGDLAIRRRSSGSRLR